MWGGGREALTITANSTASSPYFSDLSNRSFWLKSLVWESYAAPTADQMLIQPRRAANPN